MWRFACPIVKVPKWKMDAASTASARPLRTPSTRWSRVPTLPEATTGTENGVRHRAGQPQVEADLGAVAVLRGQHDLACPVRRHQARVCHRVEPRGTDAAVGEHLPARGNFVGRHALGVHRHDDALAAELLRRRPDEAAVVYGGRHDRGLVGRREQELANILERADASRPRSSGMKQAWAVRRTTANRIPWSSWIAVMSHEAELIGPIRVIGDGAFDRVDRHRAGRRR